MYAINFKDVEINEEFTYMGWKFKKKTANKALMLSNGKLKDFFENIPVNPEEPNDLLQNMEAKSR